MSSVYYKKTLVETKYLYSEDFSDSNHFISFNKKLGS